jgi:hypothetical protein
MAGAMTWFRSHHGAPTDPKWLVVARKAGVAPGVVAAVWWAVLDHASQATPRGSIEGFDAETLAAFYGWDPADITAVVKALADKGLTSGGAVVRWERRQPKREDSSTARVRAYRERRKRDETQRNARNADATLEERREEEKRVIPMASPSTAAPSRDGDVAEAGAAQVVPLDGAARQRGAASQAIRTHLWLGKSPPPLVVARQPRGWSMGNELSIWWNLAREDRVGPELATAAIEHVRRAMEAPADRPLSLLYVNKSDSRAAWNMALTTARKRQGTSTNPAIHNLMPGIGDGCTMNANIGVG